MTDRDSDVHTDENMRKIIAASDSKQIANGTGGTYGLIIRKIISRKSEFRSGNFCFIGRVSSAEAHSLAKFRHSIG